MHPTQLDTVDCQVTEYECLPQDIGNAAIVLCGPTQTHNLDLSDDIEHMVINMSVGLVCHAGIRVAVGRRHGHEIE